MLLNTLYLASASPSVATFNLLPKSPPTPKYTELALFAALNVFVKFTVPFGSSLIHVEYASISPVATFTYTYLGMFVPLIVNESVYV